MYHQIERRQCRVRVTDGQYEAPLAVIDYLRAQA